MNVFQHIHRDIYSVIIGILVLAGLIALMLYIVNPIQEVPDVRSSDQKREITLFIASALLLLPIVWRNEE